MTGRPAVYLDMAAIGAWFGVAASTVSQWRTRYADTHPFPDPDVLVGRTPGWKPSREAEIRRWETGRPATGGRRPADQALPATLVELIGPRRKELQLSQQAAANRAGVHRLTWRTWELGTAQPADYNHVGIEQALQLPPGTVDAVVGGSERQPGQEAGTFEGDREGGRP